jgi:beta-arrestin
VGDTVEDKPHKRNSVRLAIRKVNMVLEYGEDKYVEDKYGDEEERRKMGSRRGVSEELTDQVMYAPSKPGDQPSVEVSKEFMMSPNKLHLECSLDKELYYHGETISVNVHIQASRVFLFVCNALLYRCSACQHVK